MSTYTESTGFDVIEIDLATGYNPTTNNGSIIYTCPEGKFAVITQLSVRAGFGSNQCFLQIYKNHYGDDLRGEPEHYLGQDNQDEFRWCFNNLLTYNGNIFGFSNRVMATAADAHAERFLVPNEQLRVRHSGFNRTSYWRIRVEEFTAQV